MKKLHLNILHRLGSVNKEQLDALFFQQETAHKLGLKTTLFLGTAALFDENAVRYAISQAETYGDELGLTLHGITANGLGEKFGIKDTMVYFIPYEKRIKIIKYVMDMFKEKIGYYPKSVVSYILDARTLNFIHENYPSVKAAITNCFEEGVKMYYGNQNQWYLFSDGGPWSAYYPSKENSLASAKNKDDYCGIVGLPHLNRDMLMAITSRDDLFASHPQNVLRAKAYDMENMKMPYMDRFVDEWVEQIKYNGYSYYNVFVSTNWLTENSMLDEPAEFAKSLYIQHLEYLKNKIDEGIAVNETMSEFAGWMENNIEIGTSVVNKWHDLICGSKREVYWYIDPSFRVTFDANTAGSICDLRPHTGRLVRNLGNDTPNLYNMNYPFLISGEHRGGVHDGSIHTFKLEVNGKEADIALKRTTLEAGTDEKGNKFVKFVPITVSHNGVKVTVESKYSFVGDGEIKISRNLIKCSDPSAVIRIKEYHCGCWGTTTYPEDMRDIVLTMRNDEGAEQKIKYEYLGREMVYENPRDMEAMIPSLNVSVNMRPLTNGTEGKITEGWMFRPFYYMQLSKVLREGEVLESCLKIQQAN